MIAIDDDPSIRWLLGEILTLGGFNHLILASAGDGLRQARLHTPAVAVVDVNLCGVDGIEVARQIRGLSPTTEIIFLTGYGESVTRSLNGVLGSAILIEKPFDIEHLMKVIRMRITRQG